MTVAEHTLADVIMVNGTPIDNEAIASEAQNHPMPADKPGWAWQAAAHALVSRTLLLQEARARGLTPQPAELAKGQTETDDEALVRQLLEQVIEPAPVDEAELLQIYNAHPERFRGPSLFEVAHILFAARPEDVAAYEQARQSAQAVLTRLEQQPGRFAAMAAEHSACPSRDSGGLLGQLASGDTVPEFEAALATMDEGSLSQQPVGTRYGYHIIRLDGRVKGSVLPFDSVRPRLREAQEKVQWVRAGRQYMNTLIDRAEVTGIDLSHAPWTDPAVRNQGRLPAAPQTMTTQTVSRQPTGRLDEQVARRRPTVRPRTVS